MLVKRNFFKRKKCRSGEVLKAAMALWIPGVLAARSGSSLTKAVY